VNKNKRLNKLMFLLLKLKFFILCAKARLIMNNNIKGSKITLMSINKNFILSIIYVTGE
jgi:hypothetical protein